MKIAIMQPYFLPYATYYQLISSVDTFVLLDNVKYTKKGWINRNKIPHENRDFTFTINLTSGSDYQLISEKIISPAYNRVKLKKNFQTTYCPTYEFIDAYEHIEEIIDFSSNFLYEYLSNSIRVISRFLDIRTKVVSASSIPIDHNLKKEKKIFAICDYFGAEEYINLPGGKDLYKQKDFQNNGILLSFIETINPLNVDYQKLKHGMSIVHDLMTIPKDTLQELIHGHYLINPAIKFKNG